MHLHSPLSGVSIHWTGTWTGIWTELGRLLNKSTTVSPIVSLKQGGMKQTLVLLFSTVRICIAPGGAYHATRSMNGTPDQIRDRQCVHWTKGVGLIHFHASYLELIDNTMPPDILSPPPPPSPGSLVITPEQCQCSLFSMQCCGGSKACFLPPCFRNTSLRLTMSLSLLLPCLSTPPTPPPPPPVRLSPSPTSLSLSLSPPFLSPSHLPFSLPLTSLSLSLLPPFLSRSHLPFSLPPSYLSPFCASPIPHASYFLLHHISSPPPPPPPPPTSSTGRMYVILHAGTTK